MAKREVDDELLDEELVEPSVPTVGERLKAAREEKKLSLEDIAAQTRIPQRHLESIEDADWEKLPAPTYTVGFAKSYASAVGLDRSEIGDQLREEMGGQRFFSSQSEVIEAADPARTMPKWLVFSAVVAVVLLIIVMTVLNRRSLQEEPASNPVAATASNSYAKRTRAAAGSGGHTRGQCPGRGRSERRRASMDSGHRPGQDLVRGHAPAGPDLRRAPDRYRPSAQGGQAGSAQDQRRFSGRSAGRPAGQGRIEG